METTPLTLVSGRQRRGWMSVSSRQARSPRQDPGQQSYIYNEILLQKKEESHTFLLEDNNQFRYRDQIHWINDIDSLPR